MRPIDSAYDRGFANATARLLEALRNAGHTVETPGTGSVLLDGHEIRPAQWDYLAAHYGCTEDLDDVLVLVFGE